MGFVALGSVELAGAGFPFSYPHSHTWTAPEPPPAWAAVRPDAPTWAGEVFWCLSSTLEWVSTSSA